MRTLDHTVLAELQRVRESEAELETMYRKLRHAGPARARSFIASLAIARLDEDVNRLEILLEGLI